MDKPGKALSLIFAPFRMESRHCWKAKVSSHFQCSAAAKFKVKGQCSESHKTPGIDQANLRLFVDTTKDEDAFPNTQNTFRRVTKDQKKVRHY